MKVFIWVQHLFGLGHARRMARLAAACGAAGMEVTVMAGGPGGREQFEGIPGVAAHQLPSLRTKDHQYTGLLTDAGRAPDAAFWAMRAEVLRLAFEETAPDILLTELFPFGRRKFADEVLPLIAAARVLRKPPLIVSSVRDIVEAKDDPGKSQQMADWLGNHFDAVLVHGDEDLIGLEATFPMVRDAGVPLHYTGYIAPEAPVPAAKAGIVVSAGSGASGKEMLAAAAVAAAEVATARSPWHIFVPNGVDAPGSATGHVHIHPFTEEFSHYLAGAEVSISEAGYNTVAETLACGTRAALVPYGAAGQTEQPLRAKALAEAGHAVALPGRELSPEALLSAIAAARTLTPARPLNLSGAKATPKVLEDLRKAAKAS